MEPGTNKLLLLRVLRIALFTAPMFAGVASTHAQAANDTLTVRIRAVPGMQYDVVRFAAEPGRHVKLVLTNADEMEHNMLINKPEQREAVVNAALALGQQGPKMNYIPEDADVLWVIPLLEPGESDSITFRAPRQTGVYPYVCTFPGHGFVMFGSMHVTNGVMPPLEDDPSVPAGRRADAEAEQIGNEKTQGHPYEPEPPYLYRVLMPDVGPAAIAVSLPNKLSYCWDAGTCRLRYAWQGEFLDMTDYWTIKGELHAKILGTVFYRDKTDFPFRLGVPDKIPSVDFKGYRLVNRFPEFHYYLDDVEVFELILAKEDGSGLVRKFRMPKVSQSVWLVHEPNDGATYTFSSGKWQGNTLLLSQDEAKEFTITMTRKGEASR
ncbi:plastocyanin/azurin family copper-binding protein [Imperialibacter roseus]|uniref:Plastocyanin/azurin family copper-binding protein n=1 Tax=Imperialibacter roseus TaxID=1324217 RepID=A0ABZ0IGR8_9BACT|nr:plastocyanin/azurin family copper-binding protein [Imperialibacter roseus]WOK04234.1 plastocyanin/azurin family copper-binding protein [Imperialibacter roseus]